LGRSPGPDDEAFIEQIQGQWEQSDLSIGRLISGLTQSLPFRNSGDVK